MIFHTLPHCGQERWGQGRWLVALVVIFLLLAVRLVVFVPKALWPRPHPIVAVDSAKQPAQKTKKNKELETKLKINSTASKIWVCTSIIRNNIDNKWVLLLSNSTTLDAANMFVPCWPIQLYSMLPACLSHVSQFYWNTMLPTCSSHAGQYN